MGKIAAAVMIWACSGLLVYAQLFRIGPDKTVPVVVSHAPQSGLSVKRIAFGQPGGSCPGEANELVDRMILPDFQRNSMEVIERQALNQIMSEHNFSQTMYADPTSAAQLGRILGPSALIIVTVNNCSSSQLPLFNDQNMFNGAVVRTFVSKTRYSLEGALRVVDLTTGQILGSHNFQSSKEKSNQSQQGQPEYPPVDEVKDDAMQDIGYQVHSMFFPSAEQVHVAFYDDKDCGLNQVYEIYKNGDREGALRLIDADLETCRSGKHKDKTLARAYYDDGLLHCLHAEYDKASALFTNAMDAKGADAVATASAACERAHRGVESVKAYQANLARIEPPPPINSSAVAGPTGSPTPQLATPAAASRNTTSATQSSAAPTVEDRLKKLDSLYKRGLITKKEYDEKRAAILKDL